MLETHSQPGCRHNYIYTRGVITFTYFSGQPHRRRSIKSASSIKSLVRKNDRPAEISTNGSIPAALVQPAGIDCTSPFVLKNYTRSSPQLLRYSTSSNSCPNSGWNGWVTRKCFFAPLSCGVVDNAIQLVLRTADWNSATRVSGFYDSHQRSTHSTNVEIVEGSLQCWTPSFQPGTGNAGSEFTEGRASTATALHSKGLPSRSKIHPRRATSRI